MRRNVDVVPENQPPVRSDEYKIVMRRFGRWVWLLGSAMALLLIMVRFGATLALTPTAATGSHLPLGTTAIKPGKASGTASSRLNC